ncbi:MAG: T9SS type A sorting domain-containing protein [Taibaiella sp.]|nr:T9SS type A sorting domain-containing protein [Taibaiella sp.]
MKKKLVLLPIICAAIYFITTGHSTGPGFSGIERTGASGTGTNCGGSGCHVSIFPTGIVTTVSLLSGGSPVTTYTAGGSYTIRVAANNPTASSWPRFGYQVSACAGSTSVGSMVAPVGSHTITASGIKICEHFSGSIGCTTGTGGMGSTYVVDVPWTAPVAGTGTITLRAVVNAVNGTGGTDGDYSIAGSSTVTEASTAGPTPITGTLSLCVGSTTTLSSTPTGGTWSSGSTGIATVVSTTGVVTGAAAGTANITYTTGTGSVSATVTVNANPGSITGAPAVCPGGTNTLTCTTPGGTWSSSSAATATVGSSTGVVSGVAAGTTTISYILSTGCYSTFTMSVDAVPAITGTNTVCAGATTTLSHSIPGGTWSSSTPTVGTVSTAGVVAGIANGTTTISYVFGTSGCRATTVVTVIGHPAITGPTVACVGITKTLNATPAGGTWASSDITKATVGSGTGVVTGVAIGTVTIKYKVTTACGTDSVSWPMSVVAASVCPTSVAGSPELTEASLQVFPNPNSGTFNILYTDPLAERAHVTVTNVLGLKVAEFDLAAGNKQEMLLNQPPGIYYIFADTEQRRHSVKMLIK